MSMRQINEYIDRYFEGTLSEAEELRLRASSPHRKDRLLNMTKFAP